MHFHTTFALTVALFIPYEMLCFTIIRVRSRTNRERRTPTLLADSEDPNTSTPISELLVKRSQCLPKSMASRLTPCTRTWSTILSDLFT